MKNNKMTEFKKWYLENKTQFYLGLSLLTSLFLLTVFTHEEDFVKRVQEREDNLYYAILFLVSTVYLCYYEFKSNLNNNIKKVIVSLYYSSFCLILTFFNLHIYSDKFPKVGTLYSHDGYVPHGTLGWILYVTFITSAIVMAFYRGKIKDKNQSK